MKISTKGRYGTRALLDIALNYKKEPVPLKDIAQRQQISLPYLEKLIAPLISGGVIRSVRGVGGGVSLVKPAGEIKLSEVIDLLEGPVTPVNCLNDPLSCDRSEFCVTRDIWDKMKNAVDSVLGSITLQDLMKWHKGQS
jgi:Rrf2 family cysteine metabolism transcriptional repressor